MNKGDLIDAVAHKTGMSKAQSGEAVSATLSAIEGCLQMGDKASFVGFGTFSVSRRSAREGRNPATGKAIKIPAKNVIKFKAGKALSEAVN